VHLLVTAESATELEAIAMRLEGSLTGCVYSHTQGEDDALYERIAARLRSRVGRLLNDKMPTGVAVSAAMNHGGPYPATGHPGFTSVGLPASITRFTALHSYDNVREPRLPPELRDRNPGKLWRRIDGTYSQADVSPRAS
jgi:NADP-dependent aldehyde dehydrogenase